MDDRNIIWWELVEAEKEVLIEKLTSELVILRARAKKLIDTLEILSV